MYKPSTDMPRQLRRPCQGRSSTAGRVSLWILYAMTLASCGERAVPTDGAQEGRSAAELRRMYSQPPTRWPKAWIDPGVHASELAPLPQIVYPGPKSLV